MMASQRSTMMPAPQVLLGAAVTTLLLWLTSPNQVSLVQGSAAFLLLLFPLWSYWHWRQKRLRGLPLFAAASAMYWLFFALQVFWGDRLAPDWRNPARQIGDEAITQAMLLVVLGVMSLWLGIASTFGRRMAPQHFPEIAWTPFTMGYLQEPCDHRGDMTWSTDLQLIGGEGGDKSC